MSCRGLYLSYNRANLYNEISIKKLFLWLLSGLYLFDFFLPDVSKVTLKVIGGLCVQCVIQNIRNLIFFFWQTAHLMVSDIVAHGSLFCRCLKCEYVQWGWGENSSNENTLGKFVCRPFAPRTKCSNELPLLRRRFSECATIRNNGDVSLNKSVQSAYDLIVWNIKRPIIPHWKCSVTSKIYLLLCWRSLHGTQRYWLATERLVECNF